MSGINFNSFNRSKSTHCMANWSELTYSHPIFFSSYFSYHQLTIALYSARCKLSKPSRSPQLRNYRFGWKWNFRNTFYCVVFCNNPLFLTRRWFLCAVCTPCSFISPTLKPVFSYLIGKIFKIPTTAERIFPFYRFALRGVVLPTHVSNLMEMFLS